MKAVLIAMLLAAVAIPYPLYAQGRGGRGGGGQFRGGGPQAGFAPRGPVGPGPRSTFNQRPSLPHIGRGNNLRGLPRGVILQPPFYPSIGTYYPSIGNYWPYTSWYPPIYMPPLYAPQQEPVQDNSNLEYEIQRLTQEVEQLRRDQVERELPPDPQPSPQITASPPTPAPPRTLVFRDGRRLTIHNYAIVGQMLWVMDENSTKIPLAELDIDATERENRGLGLRLPRP